MAMSQTASKSLHKTKLLIKISQTDTKSKITLFFPYLKKKVMKEKNGSLDF